MTWDANDLDVKVSGIVLTGGILKDDDGSGEGERVVMYPDQAHGCWYEVGVGDAIGGLWCPMRLDGSPDLAMLGQIEVLRADA